jgi:dissimilatory sulfite reductase related protein
MPGAATATSRPDVDHEGFLRNANDWTREWAEASARDLGLNLSPQHWKVIEFCRADFASTGQSPGPRRITKYGGFSTKDLYALFPGGPGKLAAKLAGLKKPTNCV